MSSAHMVAQPAPGRYRVVRTFTLNAATFTEVDLTSNTWAGHSTVPASGRTNAARARLVRINARILGVEAGDYLQVSARPLAGADADAYLSADHQAMLAMDFLPSEEASKWYWKTSGSLSVQVEVYFDILPRGV